MVERDKIYQRFSWVAVLGWMGLIFMFSAQCARVSGANSKYIVIALIKAAESIRLITHEIGTSKDFIALLNYLLRKGAHASVYFILALLVLHAFGRSGVKGIKRYAYSFIICVLYAFSDEFHQLFVSGRGAQLKDVMIDSAGAAISTGLHWLIYRKV